LPICNSARRSRLFVAARQIAIDKAMPRDKIFAGAIRIGLCRAVVALQEHGPWLKKL
jgi:hypothetical protein